MFGYVHPNIIIRVLQQFYMTFLYKKMTIKQNWQYLIKVANINKTLVNGKNVCPMN
jgi:hypothetical protein